MFGKKQFILFVVIYSIMIIFVGVSFIFYPSFTIACNFITCIIGLSIFIRQRKLFLKISKQKNNLYNEQRIRNN